MASRHFPLPTVSLRNPYKIWMPTDKNIDSDSDNDRYRSYTRSTAQSNSSLNAHTGQHMANSGSAAYLQDGYLARTVSSPTPLPSNAYFSQPSNSSSTQNSTQPFTKQHARRATTTSVMTPQTSTSSHKSYLHALDPRTYLSKRSNTDKGDKGANNYTEQFSSAEESGKERKSRHGRSSSSAAATGTTRSGRHHSIDQAAKVSSGAQVDHERDERAKKKRAKDEKTNHDTSGFDRLFPGVSASEGHTRTTADGEMYGDAGVNPTSNNFSNGQRHRDHTHESSQVRYKFHIRNSND